jgi:hypothetical protein
MSRKVTRTPSILCPECFQAKTPTTAISEAEMTRPVEERLVREVSSLRHATKRRRSQKGRLCADCDRCTAVVTAPEHRCDLGRL